MKTINDSLTTGFMRYAVIILKPTIEDIKMNTSFILKILTLTVILSGIALTAHAGGISDKELVIYYSFDKPH